MNSRMLFATLLTAGIAAAAQVEPAPLAPLPMEWSAMEGNGGPEALPGRCEAGVDNQKGDAGTKAYSVLCPGTLQPGFGGARYTFNSAALRGKRVRVSGWLQAAGIAGVNTPQYANIPGQAGLWLGVGSPRSGMRMDRMQNRAISGSTEWQLHDFVVDIPPDNNRLMIGFWMQGTGQVWARDFKVEEVPAAVPVNFLVDDPQRKIGPDLSLQVATPARDQDRYLPPPPKWLARGSQGFELCDIGVDVAMQRSGQPNLTIACGIANSPVVRQAFEAAPFRGKRVRFSGWVKTENPADMSSGQTVSGGLTLSTDNQGNAVQSFATGTTQWQQSDLVLDVPRNATWLTIGLALSGQGQVWGRDFRFEEVTLSR